MIQTKEIILYYSRSQKSGKIRIELTNPIVDQSGATTFTVTDWVVDEDGNKTYRDSKSVTKTADEINYLDSYIEDNFPEVLLLPKTERERKKMKIGLMLDTQTNLLDSGNTIYGLTPIDWEFTAE
ncbi:hypothetical protein [Flavobacterium sp. CF136]|uniref:hypothetical protein n=1 Tax=Flavobacterium sp. (strain CF136) TaxID=1144313 RepID=UPI000271A769|nr:hypothetical protein [Flavobacterium sp. CF136]EJL66320.1 hypothetical protein PMI10_00668 [Flavobacterium sp. CF136]